VTDPPTDTIANRLHVVRGQRVAERLRLDATAAAADYEQTIARYSLHDEIIAMDVEAVVAAWQRLADP
jgi:hypothetical protein